MRRASSLAVVHGDILLTLIICEAILRFRKILNYINSDLFYNSMSFFNANIGNSSTLVDCSLYNFDEYSK